MNSKYETKHALTRTLQTFAILRIEAATAQIQANVIEIQNTTVQIRSAVTNGYAGAHGHASPLRVSEENILAFLGSNAALLSSLPPRIKLPERLVYRSYITLQVGKIDALFKPLAASLSYPIEEPDSSHLQSFRAVIWLKPSTNEEIEDVQSDIFSLIAKIQESLKSKHNQLSVQRGAYAMSGLSAWLSNLGMVEESLTVVHCAANLYRTLAKANEDVYGPHLAHALREMSRSYVKTRDYVEAYKVITEAVTIGRRLANASPSFEARMQLADLVSCSANVARRNGDWTNALKDAKEALQSYEPLIGHPKSVLRAENDIVGSIWMTSEGTYMYDFAYALAELHYSLFDTRKNESVEAGVEALELYRGLEQRYNNEVFSKRIGLLCLSLASDKFRDIIPVDQALLYAQESMRHYERILENTGLVPDLLPDSVGMEVHLLSSLNRFDEAYRVCQKFERMIQLQMDSQHLRARSFLQLIRNLFESKRYAEAASTGERLLSTYRSSLSDWDLYSAYHYTSLAFAWTDDYCKSIQVAEASVNHWRTLALRDTKYMEYVSRSHITLTCRCFWAEDYEQAFNEGGEALKLYSSLITEHPAVLPEYMEALRLNIKIARRAKMEFKSLERSREVVQYSRALVNQFPDNQLFFTRCILDHARLLEYFGHLADACVTISEALKWFDDHPAQDSESAELHTFCLLTSARFYRLQGYLDRASSFCDKAIAIAQPFLGTYPVAQNILWGQADNLLALYTMGQISIALDEIDVCLQFASEHNLETSVAYFLCLDIASRIYRCNGRIDNALSIIRRSIALRKEHAWIPCSWILSDLLADVGQEAEALDAAHEAIRETKDLKNSSTYYKDLHVQTHYSLALRLFASSELTQARELLVQVRSFYQEHSKARNIYFIDLAITLWALGLLEDASGLHEEGMGARTELKELQKRLRLVFPRLADLVEVGLNRERNFPVWKNLLNKYNLSCENQDSDDILEESIDSPGSGQGAVVVSANELLVTNNRVV